MTYELVEAYTRNYPILIAGSPRSGTSWIAKIIDSHPSVLYRHEPDEFVPDQPSIGSRLRLTLWLAERHPRVAAHRPLFHKDYRSDAANLSYRAMAYSILASKVLWAKVPDQVSRHNAGKVRAAVKMVNWNPLPTLSAIPEALGVFIMRNPYGVVHSIIRGAYSGYLRMDPTESARYAFCCENIRTEQFKLLPPAAKYAWDWRAFNEPIMAEIDRFPNMRVVVYDDVCRLPSANMQNLFEFLRLNWHQQTSQFLEYSTSRTGGYFSTNRHPIHASNLWRAMSLADREAVARVMEYSPLRQWHAFR